MNYCSFFFLSVEQTMEPVNVEHEMRLVDSLNEVQKREKMNMLVDRLLELLREPVLDDNWIFEKD